MTPFARLLSLLLLTGLAACGGEPLRFAVPDTAPPEQRVSIGYSSVELREVSLPTYAAGEEIALEQAPGVLSTSADRLWADDPARAVTLELSRSLLRITGAQIAPEPWPFEEFADARVEVRVEHMLAGADGQFRISGQYFVSPSERTGRARTRLFSLSVPMTGTAPAAIAAARGQAVSQLAGLIARDGLR
ncbi:PqiC family protein [Oceanibium sediminis]|uniref:PqiC family protein n=1 Tax=Oceanibium sediminis TaxID=2026339 RepID=UPI000DD3D53F|nr:ABC-type transport auxiliary lipoprotein family protein [Oceanibium sediminis]